MKKNLLTSFLILLFIPLFSQSIYLSEQSGVLGSKLCENLVLNYYHYNPENSKCLLETQVLKNESTKELNVNFFLTSSESGEIVKKMIADLEPHFDATSYISNPEENWKAVVKIYLDGNLSSTQNYFFKPYGECSTVKHSCDSLVVYRKFLEPVCPAYQRYSKYYEEFSGDNIYVFFKDSLANESKIVCLAAGFQVMDDSLVIKGLEAKNYNLFVSEKSKIVCVTSPCPDYVYNVKFLQTFDLSACSTIKSSDFTVTGSTLCGNLQIQYSVPSVFQKGFEINISASRNVENSGISLVYTISSNSSVNVGPTITKDIQTFFTKKEVYEPADLNRPVQITLQINGQQAAKGFVRINPYSPCFDYTYECSTVTVNRNFIAYDYSTTYVAMDSKIKEDSIFVDFSEIRWMYLSQISYADSNLTIVSPDFNTLKEQKNSLVISDLSKKQYLVYAKYSPNYFVFNGQDLILPQYEMLGVADLIDCLVNGVEEYKQKEQNVYPNPSKGRIQIEGFEGEITLVNSFGNTYQASGNEQINISNIPNGLYIVHYQLNGVSYQEKLIIE